MTTITIQDLKKHGAKALADDRVTTLIVNSKPKGVFVPPDLYEALVEAMEDLEDLQAIAERKEEPTYTLEKVFPEFHK